MKSVEEAVGRRIQIWSLLGPFIILSAFILSLLKIASEAVYIPLVALIALPLCLFWKKKGLLVSIASLILASLFLWQQDVTSDHLWHFGMTLILGLGLVVSTLSATEIYAFLQDMQIQAMYGPHFHELEVLLHKTREQLESEKEGHTLALEQAHHQLLQEKQQSLELRTALSSKDIQLKHLQSMKERLDQQLFEASQREVISKEGEVVANRRLSDLQLELQQLEQKLVQMDRVARQKVQELSKQLEQSESALIKATHAWQEKQEQWLQERGMMSSQLQHLQREVQEEQRKVFSLSEKFCSQSELLSCMTQDKQKIELQCIQLQEALNEAGSHLKTLVNEKHTLEERLRNSALDRDSALARAEELQVMNKALQDSLSATHQEKSGHVEELIGQIKVLKEKEALYIQLRKQFEEKHEVLSATRRELFRIETAFYALQKKVVNKNLERDIGQERLIKELAACISESDRWQQEAEALRDLMPL